MLRIVIQLGVDIAAGGGRDRELEPSGIVEFRMAASEQVWAERLEIHNRDYRVWLEAQTGGFCSWEPRPPVLAEGGVRV